MTREGLRAGQVAFYWGNKTSVEISTLSISGSGDLLEGDTVFNTDTKVLMVYTTTFGGSFKSIYSQEDSGSNIVLFSQIFS